MKVYVQVPTSDVLTFCKCGLFNQIWLLLLDDAFMEVYKHGIKLMCGDGVVRRLFLRFFNIALISPRSTPRNVAITALRSLVHCLYLRCLTTKGQVAEAGTRRNEHHRARKRNCSVPHARVVGSFTAIG